ncbi:MCE family protein [Nocardia sp. CA2R105]|uniref:MlaD family protein n=1 Tax=Nocardia coffeae TaxID=2873381 RepID=UPI001CA73CDE|nr:MCE family protein [Nocardia coffeae]MBY8863418.1 MCE family protein [Nocardia coffeae]
MTSTTRVVVRLVAFTAVIAVMFAAIIAAITRPVGGETDFYTARFTDASGLKTGDDVRMYGVAVGKVGSVALDGSIAGVRLTIGRGHTVFDNTMLAIRYQNLTGQRYIDIQQPQRAGRPLAPGATIDVGNTLPSFDITSLFNGLQPVLAEFSPGALNQFAQSILAVVQGNGNGLGPALDAIDSLSRYVTDRQHVISTLVHNLQSISDQISGRSPQLITLITGLADVWAALQQKIDGMVDYALTIPPVLLPLDHLAATLGFTPDPNTDLTTLVHKAFPDPKQALDVLGALPGLLQSLNTMVGAPGPDINSTCSHGAAPVPGMVQVLLHGQRISICNR